MPISPRMRAGVVWTAAGLGVLSLAWAFSMMLSGLSPLVLTDAAGALPSGSLALTKLVEADGLVAGEVVALPDAEGDWSTVRVVHDGQVPGLDQGGAVQRVTGSLPWLGVVAQAVMSPLGAFGAGVLAGAATLVAVTDPRLVTGNRRLSAARARERSALLRFYTWSLLVAWVGLVAGVAGQHWGMLSP